jgi:hypothetical protein
MQLSTFAAINSGLNLKDASSPWSYSANVSEPGYPTYNGYQVILAPKALNNFQAYMKNKKLPFTYDIAIAAVK